MNESFAPTFEDRVKLQIAQNLLVKDVLLLLVLLHKLSTLLLTLLLLVSQDAPLSMLVSDAERKQMRSLPRKLRKKLK